MLKKLTNLSLVLLAWQHAAAESAGDYLHRGAQKYIFGEKEQAKTEITTGLQKFPADQPLQQMLALFREEQQKQQQQNEQKKQDEQKQQNKDQQKQEQEQKQDGQKQDREPQKSGDSQEKKDGDSGQQQPPEQAGKPEQKDGQAGQPKDGTASQPAPEQSDRKLSGEVKATPSQSQPDQNDQQAEAVAEQEAAEQGKMTERQAKALLDSLKGEDEKVRLLDPNERKRTGRVLRDW